MFGFLRRLFYQRKQGYRCDSCKCWIPRSRGKAFVRHREKFTEAVGPFKAGHYMALELLCSDCRPKPKPPNINPAVGGIGDKIDGERHVAMAKKFEEVYGGQAQAQAE